MKLMKVSLLLTTLVLTSCFNNGGTHRPSNSTSDDSTNTVTPSRTSTTTTSTTTTSTIPVGDDEVLVNFTAVNDFHGQIDESNDMVGLAKMATYIKDRKTQGDILISSGDVYQGSFLCNYDKGHFLTDQFKELGFDAMTLGNHEFDWGVQSILNNEAVFGEPFLGANIYKYPKTTSEWEKADLGQEYKIVTVNEGTDNEVKVGIIGVIGKDQITSITSTFTEDYIFLDPVPIVKTLSVELHDTYNCDIVVVSAHVGEMDASLSENVPGKDYRYVDACFLAHTHQFEYGISNDVPFIQAGAYGQGVSSASLVFNKATKKVRTQTSSYIYLADPKLNLKEDTQTKTKIQNEKNKNADKYNNIIGVNSTGRAISTGNMSRFYAKLTYDKALIEAPTYDIKGVMFNYSRRSLKAGNFTYADLFETHPFLNEIYIFSISKKDFENEKSMSYGYIDPDFVQDNKYHDVVVFNYTGFHIGVDSNYNKYYNYYPSAFTSNAEHPPVKLNFNCFETALEWLDINHSITTAQYTGSGFFGGYGY